VNQEQRKTKERTHHEDEIPGLDPSLDRPATEEPNYNSPFQQLVGFIIWLNSTESATGLVLTLAEQGVRRTGVESASSYTTHSHHLQFYSDFSLSLSSSLRCFLTAPRVQIERQLVRLVYFN